MVAIPQSGLLAQVSSLRLPLGHSGPVLTLSNAARTSLPSPRLLVAGTGVCAASPWAGNLWVLIIYLFFLPVMLSSVLPRLATDSVVSLCLETSLFLRLPSWDRALSLPLLSFIFFPTSFRRQWAAFLGA